MTTFIAGMFVEFTNKKGTEEQPASVFPDGEVEILGVVNDDDGSPLALVRYVGGTRRFYVGADELTAPDPLISSALDENYRLVKVPVTLGRVALRIQRRDTTNGWENISQITVSEAALRDLIES